jgi:hypothetical protein
MSAPDRSLDMGRRTLSLGREPLLPRGLLAALFATIVVLALAFSTLRGHIIELRYRVAQVVSEERALEEQRRGLTVRVRQLRDPRHLAELASERGFASPERVVDLGTPGAVTR